VTDHGLVDRAVGQADSRKAAEEALLPGNPARSAPKGRDASVAPQHEKWERTHHHEWPNQAFRVHPDQAAPGRPFECSGCGVFVGHLHRPTCPLIDVRETTGL